MLYGGHSLLLKVDISFNRNRNPCSQVWNLNLNFSYVLIIDFLNYLDDGKLKFRKACFIEHDFTFWWFSTTKQMQQVKLENICTSNYIASTVAWSEVRFLLTDTLHYLYWSFCCIFCDRKSPCHLQPALIATILFQFYRMVH